MEVPKRENIYHKCINKFLKSENKLLFVRKILYWHSYYSEEYYNNDCYFILLFY